MEVTHLFDFIYYQQENYPQDDALAAKENGQWRKYSTNEVIDKMNQFSRALLKYGIKKDDKVGLIANNRPEWNIADYGMLQVGAINVPIYPTISEGEYEFIFNNAEIRICFVSGEELYKKVMNIKDKVPTLEEVYTFDDVKDAKHWTEFFKLGELDDNQNEVDEAKKNIDPHELATLIYTSGTTGNPKGVMLSHDNIVSNVKSTMKNIPLDENHRVLSFLPLCHIFERMVAFTYVMSGTSIYYAENMDTIADNLKEVEPHFFTTVPRLLEKVYERIVGKGMDLTGMQRKLFFWALDLGLNYDINNDQGPWFNFKLSIANKLIFSKWREALGGNIIGVVTGAAACPAKMAKVFTAAGIPIKEGYGQTETSPVLTFNRFEEGGTKFGTVGKKIDGVQVEIAEDGEIIAKGPNIMLGYYKNEEETKKTIDEDGWLHTGDMGKFDGEFLKITGRKKELFKTSGGKYVAPQPVENKMKESFYIEQIMVIGENKKFVSALIVPSFEKLTEYCKERNLACNTREEIVSHQEVNDLIQSEIDKYNKEFSNVEQIKKFKLIPREWTIDSKELTPTMKVRRGVVEQEFSGMIGEMYAE